MDCLLFSIRGWLNGLLGQTREVRVSWPFFMILQRHPSGLWILDLVAAGANPQLFFQAFRDILWLFMDDHLPSGHWEVSDSHYEGCSFFYNFYLPHNKYYCFWSHQVSICLFYSRVDEPLCLQQKQTYGWLQKVNSFGSSPSNYGDVECSGCSW